MAAEALLLVRAVNTSPTYSATLHVTVTGDVLRDSLTVMLRVLGLNAYTEAAISPLSIEDHEAQLPYTVEGDASCTFNSMYCDLCGGMIVLLDTKSINVVCSIEV